MRDAAQNCLMFLVLLLGCGIAGAQSPATDQSSPEGTQARKYWVDPATGLMWAAKDNGKDLSWKKAVKYCRDLRLAGFSDWRLGTLAELATLVDKSAPAPKQVNGHEVFQVSIGNAGRHVRGDVALTGAPWSNDRPTDRLGRPYGDGWFFDFATSKPSYDLPYFRNTKDALCVRDSGK